MRERVLRHCGSCERGRNNDRRAKKRELGHGILLFVIEKLKYEPHVELYACAAQTQLKKSLF
jgi:hypothetical protein